MDMKGGGGEIECCTLKEIFCFFWKKESKMYKGFVCSPTGIILSLISMELLWIYA